MRSLSIQGREKFFRGVGLLCFRPRNTSGSLIVLFNTVPLALIRMKSLPRFWQLLLVWFFFFLVKFLPLRRVELVNNSYFILGIIGIFLY